MRGRLKATVRKQLIRQRKLLSSMRVRQHSLSIYDRLIRTKFYQRVRYIAIYEPFNGEVDVSMLLEHGPFQHKVIHLPIIDKNSQTLLFSKANARTPLIKNNFGVLEPDLQLENIIALQDLDLIIVPLVGFDSNCCRIGMGGGFYDKTLAGLPQDDRALVVGVAYDFQHCHHISPEPWDVQLDYVITERGIYAPYARY